ncbi:hypothetical protein PVAND_012571 [Polypedilum vanderplanki]|uniref:Ionotropic receptor n=1 Tax=Polypedilum vanderplanki TaxID=319348 RepID=A0A9J6CLX4_POLVA|nr:hypothetical protein PVAND_012571 [Polypedilum vanderplanki]
MKIFLILLTFFALIKANRYKKEAIAQAMCEVIEKSHKNENWVLNLIIFGEESDNLKDIANELIKRMDKSKPLIIKHIEKSQEIKLNNSAIILLKSINDLNTFNSIARIEEVQRENLNFYVHFEQTDANLQKILLICHFKKSDDGCIIEYEYLFLNFGDEILRLMKFDLFSKRLCNFLHPSLINFFFMRYMEWNHDLEIRKKYENFYGCQLFFGHALNTVYYHYTRNYSGEIVHFGIIPLMIDAVSKVANYSYVYVDSKIYVIEDKSLIVAGEMSDLHIRHSIIHKDNKITDLPILDGTELIFIITPGELYTIYEKLFLPFDELTWILLCFTFTTAFIVIFTLKFLKIVRISIYGKEVKNPTLNVVSIFFGNSLIEIPTRNIPRFILILFIWFCLMFRTCYQSKLFEFMTSEMRRPEIQTIDELFEKNYTIYSDELNCHTFNQIYNWPKSKLIFLPHGKNHKTPSTIMNLLSNFNTTSERQAVIIGSGFLLFYEKYFETKFKVLKQPFLTMGTVLLMGKNHFYSHIFYKTLRELMPSGIPYHFTKIHKEIYYKLVNEKEEKEPKVLTLDDLDFGFFIWFPFIAISIIVFILELIIFKLTNKKKRFRKIKFAKVHPIEFSK